MIKSLIFGAIGALVLLSFLPMDMASAVDVEDDVNVVATVGACGLDLLVNPEKRIPRIGNWQTVLTIEIISSGGVSLGTFVTNSDSLGNSFTDICALGFNLSPGTYTLKIRGLSHLTKNYFGITGFDTATTFVNLTGQGDLLAGETSVIWDNYINTLDLATQIATFYTNDNRNDLNQDGLVNSLDISNTITNYLLSGE